MNFKTISYGVLLLALFFAAVVFGGEHTEFAVYLIGCWTVGGLIAQASRWLAERF